MRPRTAFIALLALALAVRLAFLAATPGHVPQLDAAHYDALACGIVEGAGYALRTPRVTPASCGARPQGENPATAFRPPAWPYVLAGVYAASAPVTDDRWAVARVVQALIGTAAVGAIALLAFVLLGRAGALVAGGLAALDSTLVVVGGSLLSEPLFVLLVALAAAAAALARTSPHRRRLLVTAGVLCGVATLVRSNGLVLVPVLALLAAPSPRAALRPGLAIAAAAAVAIAPWTIRNAIAMDAFVPVASYFGTGLSGTFNEQTRTRTDFPGAWTSPRNVAAFQDIHHSDMTELEKQDALRERALAHAREHPGYVVTSALRNALRMLGLADLDWHRGNAQALSLPRWTGPLAAAGFWVLLVLAALGARRAPGALWLGVALLVASAVWFGGEARYRAPLVPLLAVYASSFVVSRGSRNGSSSSGTPRSI